MATVVEQCTNDLRALMQAVVQRIEAGKKGEPIPHFNDDQMTGLLLCVGGTLIANYRALKAS